MTLDGDAIVLVVIVVVVMVVKKRDASEKGVYEMRTWRGKWVLFLQGKRYSFFRAERR
jgi:hypothetical protein